MNLCFPITPTSKGPSIASLAKADSYFLPPFASMIQCFTVWALICLDTRTINVLAARWLKIPQLSQEDHIDELSL